MRIILNQLGGIGQYAEMKLHRVSKSRHLNYETQFATGNFGC